ncbi:MAG: selenocysteine-specific translation elongation factor [Candidatus Sericytochromatia bacterium]|nr:selenocysteine-specific translation elongation factor [Candidatus Sericytochromatia bacterium]
MRAERASLVIGTAGHVDHGKTTLIRALTGVDTDRLAEEQRRGMTIDLGFAAFTLPGGQPAAVIDVPGHERFLKNMLAGVGGIDVALLVIAADDGVMPQTREHLAILRLLRVPAAVVALTKCDAVDAELIALAVEDVRAALADGPFRDAPLLPVSAATGEGLPALLEALAAVAAATPGRDAAGPARLPIDRVFVKQGFGTVVTGTMRSGTLREGDAVVLAPSGLPSRVRGLQVHGRRREEAGAGERVALNLVGLERAELGRGDWVVAPGSDVGAERLDVHLEVLPDAPAVAHRTRIRLHHGSGEVVGRLVLLAGDSLAPGATGLAQLVLERPVPAAYGDRFVLRRYAPPELIGGGVVLHGQPTRHRRNQLAVLQPLARLAQGDPLEAMAEALRVAGDRPQPEAYVLGFVPAERRPEAQAWLAAHAFSLGDGSYLHGEGAGQVAARLSAALEAFHGAQAWRVGLSAEELARRTKVALPLVRRVAGALVARGEWAARGRLFALPGHAPQLPADLARSREAMLRVLATQPLADQADFEPLGAGDRLGALLEDLVESGGLLRFAGGIFTTPAGLAGIKDRLRAAFAPGAPLTASQMREAIGTSRKYAIPFLEHLDASGFTRRQGDARTLLERAAERSEGLR